MTSDEDQLHFDGAIEPRSKGADAPPKPMRAKRAVARPEPKERDQGASPPLDDPEPFERASGASATDTSTSEAATKAIDDAPTQPDEPEISPNRPDSDTELSDEIASVPPSVSGPSADEQARRFLFLTNRLNLNSVLSSRMLSPRESFGKYYADLLDLSPGWVPVLTAVPPISLVEQVQAERGSGGPVLIELAGSAGADEAAPVGYVRAAAVADVKAIHFRDSKSLREHRARSYSNVHPHDALLRVSPELFSGGDTGPVELDPPPPGPPVDWRDLDRIRGALSAALAACRSGESVAVVSGVLGAATLPPEVNLPSWFTWDALTGTATTPHHETEAEQADRLVFQSAYDVLGRQDQSESWSPASVLDMIESRIGELSPSEGAKTIIDRGLRRVRELVNVEAEFEPFRNPHSPYVATKALLLVLLRPDLASLLEWPANETGADDTTVVVAAVLSGRLRGLSRESVVLRSMQVDDLTAAWAVRVANGQFTTLGIAEFLANELETALLINGEAVATSAPLIPDPVPIYWELAAPAQLTARIRVSTQLGWPVRYEIHLPMDAEVHSDQVVVSVTSTELLQLEPYVDEPSFLRRLSEAKNAERAIAGDLFGSLRDSDSAPTSRRQRSTPSSP